MNGRDRRVVVVGGGIIGATCAHFLASSNWRVTVLDRGAFGEGAAVNNCGLISPSHILPLAEPGVIRKTLRAMLQPDSPFAIKPGFNLSLWSWLWHFARRCNTRDMMDAAQGIQALLESSLALYRDLIERESLDCEWEHRGLLTVFRDPHAMEDYAATDRLLREEFGYPATRYDGDAVAALEPALKPGLAGGWHYEQDAHLRTDKLLRSWRRRLEDQGVTIREHCTATAFLGHDGHAHAVATARGEAIPAEAVVVAAGAWTPLLNEELGCQVPIQPGKGYSLTMPRPAVCPTIPLLFLETRVIATPFPSGYRLGSTMEFAGYDDTLNRRRLELLKKGAEPYLKEPYCEPIEQEWFGWRPMTYDSLPIIDFAPHFENVLIAAGHSMLGLSMAPGTARLVAEMLNGDAPHLDPTPYRLARFDV